MARRHPHVATALTLVVGLTLGWLASALRGPSVVLAHAVDRSGESVVLTAPLSSKYNPRTQVQMSDDGLFYLNYATGKLLAAAPSFKQTAQGVQFLGEFAERDLVKDFGLAPGTSPRFLMTTTSLGSFSEGGSALIIFETTSGQVATYRMSPTLITKDGAVQPNFELLERRTDARLGHGR